MDPDIKKKKKNRKKIKSEKYEEKNITGMKNLDPDMY